jgi:hypothetical protein
MRQCKYCGKDVEGKGFVCNECRPYVKFTLGKKMNLTGSPKEIYFQAITILQTRYEAGESTITLASEFKVPEETIWYNLKKANSTRNLREAQKVAIVQGRKQLPEDREDDHYKHGFHTSWEGKKFWYRSGWEDEFASNLDLKQIPYEMETVRILYWDSQEQKERIAIPDFYLPGTNELIEIKSTHTYNEQNMRDKIKAYRKAGYEPKLILDKKEMVL